MSVKVYDVEKNSLSYFAGIKANEQIVSINSNIINDVLDYRFHQVNDKLDILVKDDRGKDRHINIEKEEYEDIGLIFETYLMDEKKHCKNKCIFCFIDQLPQNMRKSLYFKDDDSRLSFLFGNYITLTNLTEHEINRIISLHISPINVSVHTTDIELRNKMMNNKFAGDSLKYLYKFAENNIKINCQIVLCPEWNDKEHLVKTLDDLKKLYPAVQSISVVPVGITKYRQKLTHLRNMTFSEAKETLSIVNSFNDKCMMSIGERLAFCSDEIYLLAKTALPNFDYYGDFYQLENGVGTLTLFEYEFLSAFKYSPESIKDRHVTIATGVLAFEHISHLVEIAKSKYENLYCNTVCIKNHFFGESITVTGLITGQDIIKKLKNMDNIGDILLISKSMLKRDEDIFLDDISLEQLEEVLSVKVFPVEDDGGIFLDALLGEGEF